MSGGVIIVMVVERSRFVCAFGWTELPTKGYNMDESYNGVG